MHFVSHRKIFQAIDELLKEIGNALLASDVNVSQVMTMRQNIKSKINLKEMGAMDRRKIVQQVPMKISPFWKLFLLFLFLYSTNCIINIPDIRLSLKNYAK